MTMLPTMRPDMMTLKSVRAGLRVVGGALMLTWMSATTLMASAPSGPPTSTSLPVIVADFNHDGIPDVLVPASSGATATIAFGTVPYGSFSSAVKAVTFPSACTGFVADAGNFGNLLAGDLNGDGFADIVFTCNTSGNGTLTGVMLGNGDGTFATPVTLTSVFGNGAVLGDFDHDGKTDIVMVAYPNGTYFGTNDQNAAIFFFKGNGNGSFAPAVSSPLGTSATFEPGDFILGSPVAADVNGDGYPDLILNGAYGYTPGNFTGATLTISVFGNRRDGTFGATAQATRLPDATIAVGTYPASSDLKVIAGSFSGSGKTDFIVPDSGTAGFLLVRNTSTATTYSLAAPVRTPYAGLTAAVAGSFTGSGVTDLLVANGATLAVLANDGAGNFAANYAALSTVSTSPLFAVADANLDGYADVYTATFGTALGLGVNLVNGSATSTSQPFSLGIGTKAVSANWPGNVLFSGATANGTQTVVGAPSLTTLSSSKNPSTIGDSVMFVAVVASVNDESTLPTGTVVFTDGTSTLGSSGVNGLGAATVTTSALTAATHTIVATYSGDGLYAPSVSQTLSQVVNRPAQVMPTLTWPVPGSISYGTALSGTQLDAVATNATGVSVPGTYVYVPAAGTVLSAGTQTLSVTFTPTDLTTYSAATATVPLTVLRAAAATTLTVTSGGSAASTVAAGSVVTLTATVSAGSIRVTTGLVKFCDAAATYCADSHLLGTAQLTSAGTAILRFIPGAGPHSYKAVFVGTGNDGGSSSGASPLTVTAANPTTVTIAQSGTVGNYTLSAAVAGTGATSPSGSVSFLDTSNGNAVLASGSLAAAQTTVTLTTAGSTATDIEPAFVATADLNGDGRPDLVIVNDPQLITSPAEPLTILLANVNGTFTRMVGPPSGNGPSGLAVADFNGDGKADLAVVSATDNRVSVFLGNGDGTFGVATSLAVGSSPGSIASGDFNGDGKVDLAILNFGSQTLTLLLGNGDGTFTVGSSPSFTGAYPRSVTSADFNGDGKVDLIVVGDNTVTASGGGFAAILLSNGDGTFAATQNLALTGSGFSANPVIADFNGDGKSDLIAAGLTPTAGLIINVYLGNGDGTFVSGPGPNVVQTSVSSVFSLNVADFNGDGKPDLSIADYSQVALLTNNGDGTFTAATQVSGATTDPDYFPTLVGDFNGDGVPDVVTVNSDLLQATVLLTSRTTSVSGIATGVSPLGTGPHQVVASYPGDGVYAAGVSAATGLTGQTFTPVLTWTPAVSTIGYGTALGGQQLNATAAGTGGVAVAGTFTYTPATGTVLGAGAQTLRVVFTPTSNVYVPVSGSATITVTQAQPVVAWATPAAIAYGTPLSGTQLNATVTGVGTGTLAGVLTYTPAAGTVLAPGTQTLSVSFAPTDAVDYTTATASVSLTVTGPTLNAITPSAVPLGSGATTLTLTGSGFVANSVVQVNGTAVATTYVGATSLTAIVPATYFGQSGALSIRVLDPAITALSAAQTLTVIPAVPAVTLSGPSVTSPGSQPAVTLTITNPYPLPLTATFSLSFASSGSTSVDDPAIQFAAGGRTLTLTVPANSTVVPPIQLQAGTDAGTITIPLVLTTGGVNVTPAGLAPVVIVVPATVPTISTTTVSRGSGTLSVAIHGFSNTREVTMATFHFVAAPGATISTPDLTAPVGTVFGGWFGSPASVAFGSTFTYTQVFNVSDDPKNIGSVQVTLTNGVGTSALIVAQ